MGRPGEKITRKTIMMQNKMKELDLKERSSKSLLANVLDMDDDFRYIFLYEDHFIELFTEFKTIQSIIKITITKF